MKPSIFALCLAILSQSCFAVRVGNVELPDQWLLGSQTLPLNGSGVRKYGLFNIAVYAAALYTVNPTSDSGRLLLPTTPKVLHLKMLRAVNRTDSVKAWKLYLNLNCVQPCSMDDQGFQGFLALIKDANVGDTQTYVFNAEKLVLFINSQKIGEVTDPVVVRAVLESWIGREPTTEDLKKALLGRF
jgi:Chalcone isomerase-like